MPATQSAKSHTALDPLTHFILGPIFAINLGLAINYAVRAWPIDKGFHLWLIVLAVALLLLNIKTRVYSLRVQDRVIRLEERLRLQTILPASEIAASAALTTRQLIALPLRLRHGTPYPGPPRSGRKPRFQADQSRHRHLAPRSRPHLAS